MSLPILLAALLAPAAAPAETPRAFVARVYAAYRNENFSPFTHPERLFTPPFVAALKEDARLFRGEVGYIDADPICQCQDTGGLRAEIREVRQPSPAAAEVRVTLRFGGSDARSIQLKLARTAAGWRIADIAAADEPSFLRGLEASNRRKRSGR
jgi:hypothetical protein